MPPDAAFSHRTAAALWELPLPRSLELRESASEPLDVTLPNGRRLIRARGIVGHESYFGAIDVTDMGGLAVMTPERTFCDLAAVLTLEQLIAVGDRLLWRRHPLTTSALLASAAVRHRARRGRPTLLSALGLLSDRADSAPESILRVRLIGAGLPTPHPNFTVLGARSDFVARVDLAFPEHRMAVEYEGDHHRTDIDQWRRDLRRVPALEDIGWHMTRASAPDLSDSRALIATLTRRLRERGWRGPP